jgi:transposase-like protein
MTTSYLSAKHFHDEDAAIAFVETRVWPNGTVCPKCGVVGGHYKLQGKSTRKGVYKCHECRKPFTVRVGTIFEDSKVQIHLWLQAIYLIAASKKGISANQLHRVLGVTLKTAWFMGHRIRHAMAADVEGQLGGEGTSGIVEADETYFGKVKGFGQGNHQTRKHPVVALVERNGRVRAFHVARVNVKTLKDALEGNVAKSARLMTDAAPMYRGIGKQFASHEWVDHGLGEYARGDVTTNTVEGFFGVLKMGIRGVYQHVAPEHLNRYVSEFAFRYNNRKALGVNDSERADNIIASVIGKRLTYETVSQN